MSTTWSSTGAPLSRSKQQTRARVQEFSHQQQPTWEDRPHARMGPSYRGGYQEDSESHRGTSNRAWSYNERRREGESDRPGDRATRSRSPSRGSRYEGRGRILANMYRPAYPEEVRGTSSPRTSTAGSPYPHPDRKSRINTSDSQASSSPIKTTPHSVPTAIMSVEMLAEAKQALGHTVKEMANAMVLVSSLQAQRDASLKRLEKRKSEYLKSKSHHDKFTVAEEFQRKAKEDAEKEYHAISNEWKLKDASIDNLAVQAVENVLPALVSSLAGGAGQHQQLQDRCESLERLLQNQVQELRDMKSAISQLQSTNLELDKKCSDLYSQNQRESEASHEDISKLSLDIENIKTTIVQIEQGKSPDSLRYIVDELSTRCNDLPGLRLEFGKIKGSCDRISKSLEEQCKTQASKFDQLDRLEQFVKGGSDRKGLTDLIADLTKTKSEFKVKAKKYEDLETRIAEIEKLLQALAAGAANTSADKDLTGDLIEKVSRLEQNSTQSPMPSNEALSSLTSRATAFEQGLESFMKRLSEIETTSKTYMTSSAGDQLVNTLWTEVEALKNQLKATNENLLAVQTELHTSSQLSPKLEERLDDLEKRQHAVKEIELRLNDIEKQPRETRSTFSKSTNLGTPMTEADSMSIRKLSESVADLQQKFGDMEAGQNGVVDALAEVATLCVKNEVDKLEPRMVSIENSLSTYDSLPQEFQSLKESHQQLENQTKEDIKDVAATAVEILRSNPASFTRDLEQRLTDQSSSMETVLRNIEAINQHVAAITKYHQSQLDANSLAMQSLENRFNNINTRTLFEPILQEVLEKSRDPLLAAVYKQFPSLQNAQHAVGSFNLSVETLQRQMDDLNKAQKENELFFRAIEKRVSEAPAPPAPPAEPAPTLTEEHLHELQDHNKRIDKLRQEVDNVVAVLAKVKALSNETKEGLGANDRIYSERFVFLTKGLATSADQIDDINKQVKALEEEKRAKSASVPSPKQQHDRSEFITNTVSLSNQGSPTGKGSSGLNRVSASSNRQPELPKKPTERKRKGPNGASAPTRAKANGAYNNTTGRARKRRRKDDDDDDSEDPSYEMNLPTLSSDSDDDE